MKSISSELQQHAPIRARVAFVLAVAEKVLPALEKDAGALNAAARPWLTGGDGKKGKRFRRFNFMIRTMRLWFFKAVWRRRRRTLAAIMAATSAFYYMLWHAYKLDISRGQVRRGEVPNMGEVSEEVVDEVCQYAMQSTLCEEDWLNALKQRLINDYSIDNPEDLGPVVSRQYFE